MPPRLIPRGAGRTTAIAAVAAAALALPASPALASTPLPAPVDPSQACPSALVSAGVYSDIGADAQFAQDIDCLSDYGLIAGFTDGTFRSSTPISRRQAALLLARVAQAGGITLKSSDAGFTDLGNVGAAVQNAVNGLAAAGVIKGTTATTFSPDAPLTRAQMASFVRRLQTVIVTGGFPNTSSDYFTDDNDSVHQGDINALAAAGITRGRADGLFSPHATVTRGQVAALLARLVQTDVVAKKIARVYDGTGVTLTPTNAQTVADSSQLTGLRVNLPKPDCTTQVTDCQDITLLNQLDGFDIDPRMSVTFSAAVDPAKAAAGMSVIAPDGTRTGVDRVVYDAAGHTVYAHPAAQLMPGTKYRITAALRTVGAPQFGTTEFTTESATTGLLQMQKQIDDGSAFAAANITAPGLAVDKIFPAAGTTFAYSADKGTTTGTVTDPVANASGTGAGSYVFGHYLAPKWLNSNQIIPQTPTGGAGPAVTGTETVPFVLILPAGTMPAGGWPVAIFGHGFTRSDADVFLAAQVNASQGVATIGTDVVGHGFGAGSTWQVTTADGSVTSVPAYARGFDQDGNGDITSTEGVGSPIQPNPDASISNRDGLRQTVADIMTMVRAIKAGANVAGDSAVDLSTSDISYYGQSFGGIYGTMLGGVDPDIPTLALNVDGGPVSEIARLSPSFRPLVQQDLALRKPSLLNGGVAGFTESMPLRGQPPVTDPAAGSLAIQQAIARETWLQRSGSPETFAPLLREHPAAGHPVKKVLFQNAFGDMTVPNPTTYTVLAAGNLFDRETLYRNDKTASADKNPHGFLLDPITFPKGSTPAQIQILTFFRSHGTTTIDPDGAADIFETPIKDPSVLLSLNYYTPPAK